MRQEKYSVHLFFGGEEQDTIWYTTDIEQARRWVNEAEHGVIVNSSGIAVQ
jgi:hypothetical protein